MRALVSIVFMLLATACSLGGGSGGGGSTRRPQAAVASYCPYLPSLTFTSGITVSGSAYYEFRSNGNGPISDSVHTLTPAGGAGTYSVTVNGTAVSYTCSSGCTATAIVTGLKAAVSANSSLAVTASGTSTLILTPKNLGPAITLTSLSNLTDTADTSIAPNVVHADPRPIRYAEVQVTNSSGTVVQCAETNGSGAFSFQLPNNGATYTVTVLSRANNAYNTAYIMNNPYDNTPYKLSTTVTASGSPSVLLLAKATGDFLGGAFNILDQIYNAQNYMRTKTASCNSSPSSNYFPDCTPFTTAPVVYTFWTAGLSPSTYQGLTGGISFYGTPDGWESMRGLYILGGVNGDSENSDMDHFDNSVIVHEYGHFIEYTYGRMDSPGGSHSGNGVIDPRLAWGEGWADFFQAVVLDELYGQSTNKGTYRDTYGQVGCTGTNAEGLPGCTGVTISEDMSVNGSTCSSCHDKPVASGEGNFREFSVSRILYQAARSSGTSQFSEVWTVLHGQTYGMAVVSDRFKSIGRAHKIQVANSGAVNWGTLRSNELHVADLSGYATPFNTSSCSSTSQSMNIAVTGSDNASFETSDQFRNNDFIAYTHTGGSLSLTLSWSGSSAADLDLYVYPQGYVFGADPATYSYGWVATSRGSSNTTSGSESISTSLAAGTYIINVMAYTGIYSAIGSYPTTYNLTLNGSPVCLTP